jgi:glycosyltransferase involved in cell wall biosynthesis
MYLAIIIATKNRPEKIKNLLESLTFCTEYFTQLIIVSSGINISHHISKYNHIPNLKHIHLDVSGQIKQKMEGVKNVHVGIRWVLFLDDDVTITKQSLKNLHDMYILNDKYSKVQGFGIKILNLDLPEYSRIQLLILRMFGLYSKKMGVVLKSGHAQSYQNSLLDIETQWLNGISAWSIEALKSYSGIFPEIDYAAYEDVIFSYKISRKNSLLFASNVVVVNQCYEKKGSLSLIQFKAGAYMRYYFVLENKNLSIVYLLLSQFVRSCAFIKNGDSNYSTFIKIKESFLVILNLIIASILKTNPKILLEKNCS